MDLRLGNMSGLDATLAITRQDPTARVIVLTMYEGDEYVHRALVAGAVTYLLKDTLSDELVRTIRAVHAGERPVPPEIAAVLRERAMHPPLTAREVQVLQLVSDGRRNREIATTLGISEETVQVHLKNVFTKLNVADRTAAVNVALRRGIVQLST